MRLSVKGFAVACAVIWGGAILLVAIANLCWPGYGADFLKLAASIYPGYDAVGGTTDIIVGTLYGLVDGVIGGAIFAWIYNLFAAKE